MNFIVFSYALTRTPMPFKNFFRVTAMFPIISPPFVVALSAILLFGRAGSLNPFLTKIIGDYTIYGLGGLILVETIAYAPTAFLVLYGILQAIDPSLEEASIDLGADSNTTFRRITLPMIAPAFFSGLAYNFVKAMTAISAVIFVVSGKWNLITIAILGFVDNSRYAPAAAMCNLLIVIVLIALGVIQLIVNRIGKGVRTVNIIG